MHARKSWYVVAKFRRSCERNHILSWVCGLFISAIRAYEISDDVTKFYALQKVSDVVTRCDKSASRIHASVTLLCLNKGS